MDFSGRRARRPIAMPLAVVREERSPGNGIASKASQNILEHLEPFLYGGDMIREVTFEGASWNDLPWKSEAGTPPIAQGIGLAAAVEYLQRLGMDAVQAHAQDLVRYALEQMRQVHDLELYGPEADERGGVVSFNVTGLPCRRVRHGM